MQECPFRDDPAVFDHIKHKIWPYAFEDAAKRYLEVVNITTEGATAPMQLQKEVCKCSAREQLGIPCIHHVYNMYHCGRVGTGCNWTRRSVLFAQQ